MIAIDSTTLSAAPSSSRGKMAESPGGNIFFQENVDAEAFAAHVEKSVFTASTDKIKHIFNHGIKGLTRNLVGKF